MDGFCFVLLSHGIEGKDSQIRLQAQLVVLLDFAINIMQMSALK